MNIDEQCKEFPYKSQKEKEADVLFVLNLPISQLLMFLVVKADRCNVRLYHCRCRNHHHNCYFLSIEIPSNKCLCYSDFIYDQTSECLGNLPKATALVNESQDSHPSLAVPQVFFITIPSLIVFYSFLCLLLFKELFKVFNVIYIQVIFLL